MSQTTPTAENMMSNFKGARIACFESRMADVMARSIERLDGVPITAPTMQEIPLADCPEALAFAQKLFAGEIDMVIFMTGVGARYLVDAVSVQHDRNKFIEALQKVTIVARGPKPTAVLREFKIPVAITAPEPNTWRELVEMLDTSEAAVDLKGARVAIQEYGEENTALLEALKSRGAHIVRVPIYRWALPNDTAPLAAAVQSMISHDVDVAMFTNAAQVKHLFRFASENGLYDDLKKAMKSIVNVSVGPTCSEAMQKAGLTVDFEPSRPKMAPLISETAIKWTELNSAKSKPIITMTQKTNPDAGSANKQRYDAPFLKACRGEATDITPIWLMRQAGRYMPEYRKIRANVPFLELCKNSELAAEVTITAQERIGADAAIIFSDLLVVVEPLGFGLEYAPGDGPLVSGGVESLKDVENIPESDPYESLSYVFDAVRHTRAGLKPDIPLIGFAGAPFTLASYILEGGASRNFLKTKTFMHSHPEAWHGLMEKIVSFVSRYVNGQVDAGADCIQIFDSWVGCLSPHDYRTFVKPHSEKLISQINKAVPVIHFGTGVASFIEDLSEAGGDVIGVDFRMELDAAWKKIGYDKSVQGNLDPTLLCSTREEVLREAKRILAQADGRPGHIFNLGHGILPQTPVDNVIALIDYVHEHSRR